MEISNKHKAFAHIKQLGNNSCHYPDVDYAFKIKEYTPYDDDTIDIMTDNGAINNLSYADVLKIKKLSSIAPTQSNNQTVLVSEANTMTLLKETLIDTIEKIKKDKGYIPQANAINSTVKTMVELAKAQISAIKTLKD